jgi:hypothetical protein
MNTHANFKSLQESAKEDWQLIFGVEHLLRRVFSEPVSSLYKTALETAKSIS